MKIAARLWLLRTLRLLLLIFPSLALGWSLPDVFGPAPSDIDYSVSFRHPSDTDVWHAKACPVSYPPFLIAEATVWNGSDHFITAIDLRCSFYTSAGNRIVKDGILRLSTRGKIALAPGNKAVLTKRWCTDYTEEREEFVSKPEMKRVAQSLGKFSCTCVKVHGSK